MVPVVSNRHAFFVCVCGGSCHQGARVWEGARTGARVSGGWQQPGGTHMAPVVGVTEVTNRGKQPQAM